MVGAHRKSEFGQERDLEAGEAFILPVRRSSQATRFMYVKDCHQLCLSCMSELFMCVYERNEIVCYVKAG